MAKMIPAQLSSDVHSHGEREVFEALRDKLPPEYTVFHSLEWSKWNGTHLEHGEGDFVVFHPEKGMLSIEVKSGGVKCEGNSWKYIRHHDGVECDMTDPLSQADKCMRYLIDIVNGFLAGKSDSSGRWLKCYIEAAVWFPSIRTGEVKGRLPLKYHPEIVLYKEALENPQKAIDDLFEFHGCPRDTNLTPGVASQIVRHLAPHYQAIPTLYSRRLDQEERFERLTNAQKSLIDYLDEQESAAIKGAAGTGKTVLALEKARRLAKDGKVLFICYNAFLRQSLIDVQDEHRDEYGNISFYNLKALSVKHSADIDSILANPDRYGWDYKHVVIDEAQDILNDHIVALRLYTMSKKGSFYVFFDENQYVQGGSYRGEESYLASDSDEDEEVREESPSGWLDDMECRLVLNTNCRNTLPIAKTSGKTINKAPRTLKAENVGEKPRLALCGSKREALKTISKAIDRYKDEAQIEYSQICILTLKTTKASILNGEDRIGKHRIVSERGDDGVLFTTARRFKGLEADAVIIVDMDESSFETSRDKMLFYVGASRAKHYLDIVFSGGESELGVVLDRLGAEQLPRATATAKMHLEVKMMVD